MICHGRYGLGLALLLVLMSALSSYGNDVPERPNVVVIVVDDMGYGDPSCFNTDSKISTPRIDSLARDGMRFTDAHAPGPLCHMSRYGLMTGRYPFRTDVSRWPTEPLIHPSQTTLASMLRSRGYRTAMVGKWHLGFAEDGYDKRLPGGPIDVGFDSFLGILASTDIPPYFYIRNDMAILPPTEPISANHSPGWSPIQGAFWRAGQISRDMQLDEVLTRFTDEAIAVITHHGSHEADNKAQRPLFLYLAYPAPHTPWLPSERFRGKSGAGMYGDFAVMVDAMVGRVLDTLNECGLSDDTLLVFTSDNGPVWYEADVKRFGHDSAGGLRGMKGDAWEAGHRMPFIVRWPGSVRPGSTSQQTICFTDLMATLAEVTGYRLREDEGPDSFPFLSDLLGTRPAGEATRPSLVMRSARRLMTIRVGRWKLINGRGSGGFSKSAKTEATGEPQGQLYDLQEDPAETNNQFDDHPEVVARLRRMMSEVQQSGHRPASRK